MSVSPNRAAAAVFGVLVLATFAAFFVAQRLKNSPAVIQQYTRTGLFSPNGDGRLDRARIAFKLKEADTIRLDVVDEDGDVVRTLVEELRLAAYRPRNFVWDGLADDGRLVADGIYRGRVTLRKQGSALTVPGVIRKDTRPPVVRVVGIGPERGTAPAPELLPRADGRPASVALQTSGRRVRVRVLRTSSGRPVEVAASPELPEGTRRWVWDGEVDGRPVAPGAYLAVAEARDPAGNIGTSVPLTEDRVPRMPYGRRLPGRGGITVRALAVQPPSRPVAPGAPADVFIDARGASWTWTLRRVGGPRVPIRRSGGPGRRARLRLTAPGSAGTYLLSVRTRREQQRVVLVVGVPEPTEARVLVVLPWMTWQGFNGLDDDGDGRPNRLDDGLSVRLDRPFGGDGLPVGFANNEAPALGFLDRRGRTYDLTTDIAVQEGTGPRLGEYRGVLLVGDAVWIPQRLGTRLRRYVRDGGTLVSLGTGSLRRQVDVSRGGRLVAPTLETASDLFGARLRPVVRSATDLTVLDDTIGLFEGTEGQLTRVPGYEATQGLGQRLRSVASAVTPEGRAVLVAARFGEGHVIRTGVPNFATRLTPDPEAAALFDRLWVLMAQGIK